jgi:hypothetical protein
MKMEQTHCFITLAFKLPTPVNDAEESVRHPEHRKSLKSRTSFTSITSEKVVLLNKFQWGGHWVI